MCFFGGGARAATPPKTTFDDSPPVVTGMQTGVDNPVDTAKVTEELKIKRMKKEGMSNPGDSLNIAGVTTKRGGMSRADKARRADNQERAKRNFNKRKFSRGITGQKTKNA